MVPGGVFEGGGDDALPRCRRRIIHLVILDMALVWTGEGAGRGCEQHGARGGGLGSH